jgi:hypothetical protein
MKNTIGGGTTNSPKRYGADIKSVVFRVKDGKLVNDRFFYISSKEMQWIIVLDKAVE